MAKFENPGAAPPPEEKQEEPLIKVETPVGGGRKISEEVIEENKKFIAKAEQKKQRAAELAAQDRAIKRKLKKGELLSQDEAARIRELEMMEKSAKADAEAETKTEPAAAETTAKKEAEEPGEEADFENKTNDEILGEVNEAVKDKPESLPEELELASRETKKIMKDEEPLPEEIEVAHKEERDRAKAEKLQESKPEDRAVKEAEEWEKVTDPNKRPYSKEEWDEAIRMRQEQEDAKRVPKPEDKEKEKTPEEILGEKREAYVAEYKKYQEESRKNEGLVNKARRVLGLQSRKAESEMPAYLLKARQEYDKAKFACAKDMYDRKKSWLQETGDPGEEAKRHTELARYVAEDIFKKYVVNERALLQEKQAETWTPRDKGLLARATDKWMRMPRWARIGITTAAMAGGVAATGGLAAGAAYGAKRLVGAGLSFYAGFAGGKAVDWAYGNKIENQKQEAIKNMQERIKSRGGSLKDWEMEYQKIIENSEKRERVKRWIKGGVMIGAAVGTGYGMRYLENLTSGGASDLFDKKSPGYKELEEGMVPNHPSSENILEGESRWEIGARGPEGAIIDHLRDDEDLAQSLGWDGESDLSQWAGTKAHEMWLEQANAALSKPEMLEQLKSLGYSPDIDGYGEMMRRIGKGFVELGSDGKIKLADMEYLKAKISEAN